MRISAHKHQQIRLKNWALTLAILCLVASLAWLSNRFKVEIDITKNSSNSLSEASQKLLVSLPGKIELTAYIKKDPALRSQIMQLVDRYQRHKADVSIVFVDPDSEPEKIRELNIPPTGAVIVGYQGRTEKLNFIDESALTNALMQLANANERRITFLTGHGERSPDGTANFDLGQFGKELDRRKIRTQTLNLSEASNIPSNSALLVLGSPTVPLLAGEIELIKQYIRQGGNLLIMTDSGNRNLDPLLLFLGLRQLPGTLLDNSSKLYGVNDPGFVLTGNYPSHPIGQGLQMITLFPMTAALETADETEFKPLPLLKSGPQSWTETGQVSAKAVFDADGDEKQGPLTFAYALTRDLDKTSEQRIVVVGDGDFLANAYVGNVGNLDIGLRMTNWLTHDESFIDIPAKIATDKTLLISPFGIAAIGIGFLLIMPLLLISTGFYIWRKRKRR